MSEISFRNQAQVFLDRAFTELEKRKFRLDLHWHIDHLCFRTSTQEKYVSIKRQFESFSKLLIESEVNGRLISTFKLASPIVFHDWEIDLIEVPAPKKGKTVADGFEHFEVVCDLPFEELKNRYSSFRLDESGLSKVFNKELEVTFAGFAVKFHPLSLESVINIEANSKVYSALNNSEILKVLNPFDPLVAGTFPLNLNLDGSDLDISGEMDRAGKVLQDQFSQIPDFNFGQFHVQGEPSLTSSFTYQGIKFEIFGQKGPSIRQTGYLHFLAEERLLKTGGAVLAEKVKTARLSGLKTEPAFAKALGLTGDPYVELLVLQKESQNELKRRLSPA